MVQNPLFSKIPKLVIFFSKVCVVGTLNLSQEMSDKMQNESGQFKYIELRFLTISGDCGCKKLNTILKIDTGHILSLIHI